MIVVGANSVTTFVSVLTAVSIISVSIVVRWAHAYLCLIGVTVYPVISTFGNNQTHRVCNASI